ncbi:universal stress protein [Eggerthellaceae bacterium zg-887]|uniref:universal stress protein n=1 Tax=Xiamenia xianingshaonis TaxID=2682776 RepID=UPI00140AFE8A|nr:universal stress protein [Xiamenia xianingshaonis]NHM15112.1 universal stress protein [Xiamenia xianingshaonis]
MAVNHILVAYDESEGADRALAMAADLAALDANLRVDVVYVVPIPLLDQRQQEGFRDILDMMISDGESLLTDAIDKLGADVALQFDSLLLTGVSPATEILKLLQQRNNYDMVIVGNRGLSGLKEYTGSVSLKILNGAQVPVLIVK